MCSAPHQLMCRSANGVVPHAGAPIALAVSRSPKPREASTCSLMQRLSDLGTCKVPVVWNCRRPKQLMHGCREVGAGRAPCGRATPAPYELIEQVEDPGTRVLTSRLTQIARTPGAAAARPTCTHTVQHHTRTHTRHHPPLCLGHDSTMGLARPQSHPTLCTIRPCYSASRPPILGCGSSAQDQPSRTTVQAISYMSTLSHSKARTAPHQALPALGPSRWLR